MRSSPVGLGGRSGSEELSEPEDPDKLLEERFEALNQLHEDIQPHSLEAYAKLLTEVEKDCDPTNVKEDDELLNVTRDGVVEWTATEKEILYNVLDRKGFNGIKDIAIAIGTKSELEVLEHLRVVQKTIREQLNQRRLKFITTVEIPAAAEFSEDYCAEEGKYARYLALQENIQHAHDSKLLYADYSIIRETEAQALANADINTPLKGDLNRAVGLLNMPTWISLSKDFFMNFGGEMEDNHWTKIAETDEETPSIAADAIMDFSALAISLTRRFIQSTIFMAESRIRTMDRISEAPRDVKYADVKNALEVMGLKRKRPSFVDIVRRNRIAIGAFAPQRLHATQAVSYDQAEEVLGYGDKEFYKAAHTLEHGTVSNKETDIRTDENELDYMDEAEDEAEEEFEIEHEENDEDMHNDGQTEPSHPATSQNPELPHPETSEDHQLAEDQEEEQADNIDHERSRQEELRLWQMFAKPPPPSLLIPIIPLVTQPKAETDDEKDDLALHGVHERRTQEDIVNWRDRTLYHGEWEQYGSDLEELADELAENTRKRRRVEAGDRAENEEKQEVINKDTPAVSQPQLSTAIVESEDDSENDGSESDEDHTREAESQTNESDYPRAASAHQSAPSPRKSTRLHRDSLTKPEDEENEAGDEISSDSSSDSDSSASASKPNHKTNNPASKKKNQIENISASSSSSESTSNPKQSPSKTNNSKKAPPPTPTPNTNPEDDISTDSDSSISDSTSHIDAMDLDEDFHAQIPPNGFM